MSFPKSIKLRKRPEFVRILKQGKRLVGKTICIDWIPSSNPDTRLGITASNRYGSAPERNRFKRIVREAFRLIRSQLPTGLDLNILPRQRAKTASSLDVQAELLFLLCENQSYVAQS